MVKIIPAIIAQGFNELTEKIKKVELLVDWVQLDIMDGKFVSESTWPYAEQKKGNPAELKNLKTKLNLEAHLMVERPEEAIEDWLNSGVKRIIFHFEATSKPGELIEKIRQAGLEVGMAINPETPVEVLDKYISELNLVLVMTVEPGRGGQKLLSETLLKIQKLRQSYPDVKIGADGGIDLKTAPEIIKAGVDILAVGSAIFGSDNIEETIYRLKHADN